MKSKNGVLEYICEAAAVSALYSVLTLVFLPVSFGPVQLRISEAMCILPWFTASAVPGLGLGCLLANLLGGAPAPDVIFGSLATLIGAAGTRMIKKKGGSPYASLVPPVLSNSILLPLVMKYAYHLESAFIIIFAGILISEIFSSGILGSVLYRTINKNIRIKGENNENRDRK